MLFAGTKQHNKQESELLWEENIDVSWIILAETEVGLLAAPVGLDFHSFVIENICT